MSLLKKTGIHARILSTVVIIICSLTLSLGYFGVSIINQFVKKRFYQRIDFIGRYLAGNSELGILVGRTGLLEDLAQKAVSEDDIAIVRIFSMENGLVVDVSSEIPGPYEKIKKDVTTKISGSTQDSFFSTHAGEEKTVIGHVEITYSTGEILQLLNTMKKKFLMTTALLAGVSLFVFYFISRSLVMPLNSLVKTARKVSSGNRDIRALPGDTPETARLASAFNEMLDSLAKSRADLIKAYEKMAKQESLAELGKFSMMIAHEVKNPLGIIKSSMDFIRRDYEVSKDYVPYNYAVEELLRLNTLIEDFLMFSKPAAPKFKLSDLNEIIAQVVIGYEIKYSGKSLEIKSDIPKEPFKAEVDFDLVARAFSNIIKNACEANNEKGEVFIEAFNSLSVWTLKVSDQGRGIDKDMEEKIFEPFCTGKAKGSGLGLAFAKHVFRAHDGEIYAKNLPDRGAVFYVEIYV